MLHQYNFAPFIGELVLIITWFVRIHLPETEYGEKKLLRVLRIWGNHALSVC